MVIKAKTLRLRTPVEIVASDSKCQRAKVSGSLLVIMPKINAKGPTVLVKPDIKAKSRPTASQARAAKIAASTVLKPKVLSLQEQMLQDAMHAATGAVKESKSGDDDDDSNGKRRTSDSSALLNIRPNTRQGAAAGEGPLLFDDPVGMTAAATGMNGEETVFRKIVEIDEMTDLD